MEKKRNSRISLHFSREIHSFKQTTELLQWYLYIVAYNHSQVCFWIGKIEEKNKSRGGLDNTADEYILGPYIPKAKIKEFSFYPNGELKQSVK